MSWTPFCIKRVGPRGPDTHEHLFCVVAKGNPELVRTGESDAEILVNSTSSSDGGAGARAAVTRLVDALNGVWEDYLAGRFHEEQRYTVEAKVRGTGHPLGLLTIALDRDDRGEVTVDGEFTTIGAPVFMTKDEAEKAAAEWAAKTALRHVDFTATEVY